MASRSRPPPKPPKPGDEALDDVPTRRLTAGWELHAKVAQGIAEELDAVERAERATRPHRAEMFRGQRLAVRSFVQRFGTWHVDRSITFEEKTRDLEEFALVRDAALALLNLARGTGPT